MVVQWDRRGNSGEKRIELTGSLQGMQIITTTDVAVIDEDLRNTATAIAPGSHGITTWLITIHGMLGVGNTFAIQQLFGAHAEGALSLIHI